MKRSSLWVYAALFMSPMMAAAAAPTPDQGPKSQGESKSNSSASDSVATDAGVLEEVIVTANKRSENLQRVPISIATFSGQALTTLGVKSVIDLPQLTPGLSFTRTLVGTNAFLRGVGTTSAGYSTEVPIATYIDGLYLPNSAASSFSFNNIERIEVLKGPQGTLYGRNSTGGLIHVITKEPGEVTSFDASASYANYKTVQFNFYGSTPLSDTLAANFSALYIDQAEGWGRNVFLGTEAYKFKDTGFQSKLQWKPGSGTKITLRGFYDKIDTDQGNAAAIYPGSVGVDGTRYLGEYRLSSRVPVMAQQRQYSISLKGEQDFDFAKLTSITGYINNESPSQQTQSAIPGNPIRGQGAIGLNGFQTANTLSQELQLASSKADSDLQWIVGAFYFNDRTMITTDVYGTCVGNVCAPPTPVRSTGFQKTRSYSGFAEGTHTVAPATRITLGLRYTSDEKVLTGILVPLAGFPNSVPAFPPTVVTFPGHPFPGFPNGIDTDVTFNKLTWKAVLAQDFTPDVHGYVSYNRGFKSGGFNPTSFTNPASRPEVLDAYELGVKSELLDRALRLNGAAFYYNYSDIQLRSTAPPAPPGGSLLFNAAVAHIKGVDADLLFSPVKGLTITGALELLDAKYSSFPAGLCSSPRTIGGPVLGGSASVACDLSGNRPPNAPKFGYSLGIAYVFDTAEGQFEIGADDGYKSSFFWEPDNRLKQDAFHLINASLIWTSKDPRISVQLFGRNLGGEYYFASGAVAGNDAYVPAAPRTYGVKIRYHF